MANDKRRRGPSEVRGPWAAAGLSRRRLLLGSAMALAAASVAAAGAQAAGDQVILKAAATGGEPAAATPAPAGRVNGDIYGELIKTVTWESDNLLDIARAEHLGLIEVMAANPGVDPWLPGAGKELVLPTAHILPSGPRQGIVINLSELRIYYFDPERGVYTFPIGVGREGFGTPIGSSKVVRKAAGPTWYPTPGKRADDPDLPAVVPPGPDNPLGEFALYLGWPTYLMHGTNKPYGVGRRVSRGCIRLYPEDIAFLFKQAKVGTPVRTTVEFDQGRPQRRPSLHRGPPLARSGGSDRGNRHLPARGDCRSDRPHPDGRRR